jgi:hypothetical protein
MKQHFAELKKMYKSRIDGKNEMKVVVAAKDLQEAFNFMMSEGIPYSDYYVYRKATNNLWGKYVFIKV